MIHDKASETGFDMDHLKGIVVGDCEDIRKLPIRPATSRRRVIYLVRNRASAIEPVRHL